MTEKLPALMDGLAPLLFEANVVLGIQQRSTDVGIRVDRDFVQARLARWAARVDAIASGLDAIERKRIRGGAGRAARR